MAHAVIGRGPELARIDTFLAGIAAGARVLVIEGAPGMGKTTLWLAGLQGAAERGWPVLSARPSEAEATFAYTGLGDLLEGIGDDAFAPISAPQRRALRVALLQEEPGSQRAEPGAVAVALLGALRGLARAGPILLAVDDIQWLDTPSALALGFAVRRLRDEPIGVLLARRVEAPSALPMDLDRPLAGDVPEQMAVGPMGTGALGEMLHSRLGVTFPRATLHRIYEVSGGNPLFALELGRALGDDPAGIAAGVDLPLPDELTALLGEQLATLPAETQDALAVVAVLSHPTVELVGQVVDGPVERMLAPAFGAHVIALEDDRLRFTHPLRASAARSRIPPARRREIHARLAAIVADPEEQARHLALAADGPDEVTATVLEAAARRAAARGALDAAGELVELAGRLTPSDRLDDVRRRALAEAEYAAYAPDPRRARSLGERLFAICPPGPARAQALIFLGLINLGLDNRAAAALLRQALVEVGDDDRARMRCEGGLTAALDHLGSDPTEALAHGHAELELAERLGNQVSAATALRGIARNEQRLTGSMPVGLIERSLALEPLVRISLPVTSWPSRCYAEMLAWTDDLPAGLDLWEELHADALERGDEHSIGWVLTDMIPYACAAGALAGASAHADESYDLALAAGQISLLQAVALADRALVGAHLGIEVATRHDAGEALRLGEALGAFQVERAATWALGILELSLGDPVGADEQLGPLVEGRRAVGIREPGDMRFAIDEIEALIGAGRLDEAEAMRDWYAGLAEASGRVFALAACDRGRGLLHAARGELADAIAALEESRTRYVTIADPFGLARTLLALGTVQRRAAHRRAARKTLGEALAAFERLGAALWAERARAELARIGGRQAAGDELTPSERQVALLVAEGRTNREVAAALVVSERTVEGHLSSIYAKLQVRSRSELVRMFTAVSEQPE